MSATTTELAPGRRATGLSWIWRRQLEHYPDTGPRTFYLAITVLATVTLYYELYVGGSVSTLILANLNMSFTFYVVIVAVGSLLGAFGSLAAGLGDRLGRANMVVFGLLFTGVFVGFLMPAATNKWVFSLEGFVVSVVEGVCLVATPALIRDFSPQVGRATAMGFWTAGPVLGSLIVAIVGTNTIPAVVHDPTLWTREYHICGIAGLVVFVITLFGLRELSPQLRDQLMVTLRDRALIEMRAKGLDVEAALRRPFQQLLKPDIVISALAISLMLLVYFMAVGFLVIYVNTVFGFTLKQANGLGNWEWAANVAAVILIGVIADRFRVRKPFMLIGGIGGAVMVVIFLLQFGHHPSYYTLAIILAITSICLGIAYTPWMASYTETVEHRNPALTATGLAIWGWIIRIVVFASSLTILLFVNSVTPLVSYGTTTAAYLAKYRPEVTFAQQHPKIIATAQKYQTQLDNVQRFAPELAILQAHPLLFAKLGTYPNPAKAPASLLNDAIKAAGGGTKGVDMLEVIGANGPVFRGILAVEPELATLKPYSTQLIAASRVPPFVTNYLSVHGPAVQKALADTASQWRHWLWVCFGGIIFFICCIPLLHGRWSPRKAKQDEQAHEAMVVAELARLSKEPAASA